eukprot:8467948-Alexandrium_andersonii.AAC.1
MPARVGSPCTRRLDVWQPEACHQVSRCGGRQRGGEPGGRRAKLGRPGRTSRVRRQSPGTDGEAKPRGSPDPPAGQARAP